MSREHETRLVNALKAIENGADIYEALKHFDNDFLMALSSLCCEIIKQEGHKEELNYRIRKISEELKNERNI